MIKWLKLALLLLLLPGLLSLSIACKDKVWAKNKEVSLNEEIGGEVPKAKLSEEFKKYWYAGDAEISSYKLEQARYGEIREGHAVLIYVTEPFLQTEQVKADRSDPANVPVLKLNSTKKYLTGIYPYSIMSSSFYPVHDGQHAIKVSNSVQEWCGHVYAQLNNRDKFEFMSHSYFEGEADQHLTIEKTVLENEIWNKIRINPKNLPLGELQMIPSLEYIRVGHKEIKAYKAIASITESAANYTYELQYPELERTLNITFSKAFPHTIEGWSDAFKSGFGNNAKMLISTATKMKALKTPYWRQNGNKDVILRDSLGI